MMKELVTKKFRKEMKNKKDKTFGSIRAFLFLYNQTIKILLAGLCRESIQSVKSFSVIQTGSY